MTDIWLPLAATALAAALTWWCCIRPMVKNRSCCTTAADPELQEELRRAREELQQLRDDATPLAVPPTRPEILDR